MENRILLVDDEPNILAAIKRVLIEEPCEILEATSAEQGLDILREEPCKVVISDERMPGMGGGEFLGIVKDEYPDTIRILLTGHASIDSAMKAVNCGEIYRFFTKPWNDLELRLAVRSAVEKFDLQWENMRLLSIVRKQANELKSIEERYPGITQLEKDQDGSICLQEVSEEETAKILKEWNQ